MTPGVGGQKSAALGGQEDQSTKVMKSEGMGLCFLVPLWPNVKDDAP
jgi:hypothetical protein